MLHCQPRGVVQGGHFPRSGKSRSSHSKQGRDLVGTHDDLTDCGKASWSCGRPRPWVAVATAPPGIDIKIVLQDEQIDTNIPWVPKKWAPVSITERGGQEKRVANIASILSSSIVSQATIIMGMPSYMDNHGSKASIVEFALCLPAIPFGCKQ